MTAPTTDAYTMPHICNIVSAKATIATNLQVVSRGIWLAKMLRCTRNYNYSNKCVCMFCIQYLHCTSHVLTETLDYCRLNEIYDVVWPTCGIPSYLPATCRITVACNPSTKPDPYSDPCANPAWQSSSKAYDLGLNGKGIKR